LDASERRGAPVSTPAEGAVKPEGILAKGAAMPVDTLVEGTGMPEGYSRTKWVPERYCGT